MRFETPLSHACQWIDLHLLDFKVNPSPAWLFASIKAVTELAHAADFLLRTGEPRWVAVGHRWMEFAWAEIKGGELLRALIKSDARLVPIGIAFLPFHLSGHHSDALNATMEAQVRATQMDPLGWTLTVPALEILGIAADPVMQVQARPLSVLANRTAAALLPQDAVYLLAHECLYASSWGRHAPRYPEETADYVAATLPALISNCCDVGDADVLAELVLALHSSSLPCVDLEVWKILQDAQEADGNVVSREQLNTLFPRLVHPVLQRTYHTTLVAIMAWSACRHT